MIGSMRGRATVNGEQSFGSQFVMFRCKAAVHVPRELIQITQFVVTVKIVPDENTSEVALAKRRSRTHFVLSALQRFVDLKLGE